MPLVIIRKTEFVGKKEFTVVVPLNKSFISDHAFEPFENIYLGPVGYQVPVPKYLIGAVDLYTSYSLRRLILMQSLVTPHITSKMSLIFLYLILQPSF